MKNVKALPLHVPTLPKIKIKPLEEKEIAG
jgi:hypothetical protein